MLCIKYHNRSFTRMHLTLNSSRWFLYRYKEKQTEPRFTWICLHSSKCICSDWIHPCIHSYVCLNMVVGWNKATCPYSLFKCLGGIIHTYTVVFFLRVSFKSNVSSKLLYFLDLLFGDVIYNSFYRLFVFYQINN